MHWHVFAYNGAGGAATDQDLTGAADEVFQLRNSHFIFSDPTNIRQAYFRGATATRLRFSNVTLTRRGFPFIWPFDTAATVSDTPQPADFRLHPIELPIDEEVTLAGTYSGAGIGQAVLWATQQGFNSNRPMVQEEFITRCTTVAAAGSETTWNALSALTFTRDLQGGIYTVLDAWAVAADAVAFRLFFPTGPLTNGRRLRPGGLVQNTIGTRPLSKCYRDWGEWGRFRTFEPPQIQFYGDAAGGTYDVYLHVGWLGDNERLLMVN